MRSKEQKRQNINTVEFRQHGKVTEWFWEALIRLEQTAAWVGTRGQWSRPAHRAPMMLGSELQIQRRVFGRCFGGLDTSQDDQEGKLSILIEVVDIRVRFALLVSLFLLFPSIDYGAALAFIHLGDKPVCLKLKTMQILTFRGLSPLLLRVGFTHQNPLQ